MAVRGWPQTQSLPIPGQIIILLSLLLLLVTIFRNFVLFIFFVLVYYIYLLLCVHMLVAHRWRSEGNCQELILSSSEV